MGPGCSAQKACCARNVASGVEAKAGTALLEPSQHDATGPTDYHTSGIEDRCNEVKIGTLGIEEKGRCNEVKIRSSSEGNVTEEAIWSPYYFCEELEATEIELRRLSFPVCSAPSGDDLNVDVGDDERRHRRYIFRSGAVYNGGWRSSRRDGMGVQVWLDGASYAGEWSEGTPHGRGTFSSSQGDEVTSEWRRGHAHGVGIFRHNSGMVYQGSFVGNLEDGQGIELWPDGSRFMGDFARGMKCGFGVFVWADSSSYAGHWEGDVITGAGSFRAADGRTFCGRWHRAMMHGVGLYRWPRSMSYAGQYTNDQKDGFGIFVWPDGRCYEGFWLAGRQHGVGRIRYSSGGACEHGVWEHGARLGDSDGVDSEASNALLSAVERPAGGLCCYPVLAAKA